MRLKQTFSHGLLGWILLGVMVSGVASAKIDQNDPEKMVKALSLQVLEQIDQNREALESDPQEVKSFANKYVLPYVDTEKMARYVMARQWRNASASQQKAFSEAFTDALLRTYSRSLLKLNVTEVKVSKVVNDKPGRASVTTDVQQADGNESKVIYRAFLDKKTNKWMLYDVVIEGVSLLLNYRKTYASEFDKKGIDTVISELKTKNEKAGLSEEDSP